MNTTKNGDSLVPAKLTESPLNEINMKQKNHLMEPMIIETENNCNSAVSNIVITGESSENMEFEPELTIDDLNISDGIKETIKWLVNRGLPALPVVPLQEAYDYPLSCDLDKKLNKQREERGELVVPRYACPFDSFKNDNGTTVLTNRPKPKFTGKNPSYIDNEGFPRTLNHGDYQTKLPTIADFLIWWSNPTTGIGSLGSWCGTIWIDIDAKNFDSVEGCEKEVIAWLDKYPALKNTFIERTQSGGFTVGVKVSNSPPKDEEYTNFSFSPGGAHIGEAIGRGRFKVLAPSVGVKGAYVSINRGDFVEVESLESIGIFPSSNQIGKVKEAKKTKTTSTGSSVPESPRPQSTGEVVLRLEDLISPDNKKILEGEHGGEKDRSKAITTLAKELIGWVNWCETHNLPCDPDYETLLNHACSQCGIDADRCDRILESMGKTSLLMPATHRYGDIACWKKVYKVGKDIFEAFCPHTTQVEVKKSMKADGYDIEINESSENYFEDIVNEGMPTDEEIEEKQLIEYERKEVYEKDYSLGGLPIADNWNLFLKPFSERLKKKADALEVKGASYAMISAICALMATTSPITKVSDGVSRELLAHFTGLLIADTGGAKTPFTTNLLNLSLKLLGQIDNYLLEDDINNLMEDIPKNDELKIEVNKLKSIIELSNDYRELREIGCIMFDEISSSKQGVQRSGGLLLAGLKVRKLKDMYFNGLFVRPILLHKDEGGTYLIDFYRNKFEPFEYNKSNFNAWKAMRGIDISKKRLTSKSTLIADLPRTIHLNVTLDEIRQGMKTEQTSSNGFTGRWYFSIIHSKRIVINRKKLEGVLGTDRELELMILGATIINYVLTQKLCNKTGEEKSTFTFSYEGYEKYADFWNDDLLNVKDEIITKHPDWNRLVENVASKAGNLVYEIAPNLKRFNHCLYIFLKRLGVVYPGRKLIDFSPLLEYGDYQDNLVKFTKALITPIGGKGNDYYQDLSTPLSFDDILQPTFTMISTKGIIHNLDSKEHALPELCKKAEFIPVESLLDETDIKKACDCALNSMKSFGLTLDSFKIMDAGSQNELAKTACDAKSIDVLLKSDSEAGDAFKIDKIVHAMKSKQIQSSNVTIGKLKNASKVVKKMSDDYIKSVLDSMIPGGYLEKTSDSYVIKKSPSVNDVKKITLAFQIGT